jgi:hypothetical protein
MGPVSSGIILPGSEPLPLKEVQRGLFLAENAYACDYGYFSRSPLYGKEAPVAEQDAEMETAANPPLVGHR